MDVRARVDARAVLLVISRACVSDFSLFLGFFRAMDFLQTLS